MGTSTKVNNEEQVKLKDELQTKSRKKKKTASKQQSNNSMESNNDKVLDVPEKTDEGHGPFFLTEVDDRLHFISHEEEASVDVRTEQEVANQVSSFGQVAPHASDLATPVCTSVNASSGQFPENLDISKDKLATSKDDG